MTTDNILAVATAGDVNVKRVIQITGLDTLDSILEIRAHVWQSGVDAEVLDVEITDSDACTVTLDLGAWITDATPGNWLVEFELDDAAGTTETWPGYPAILPVRASGN